MNSVNVDMDDVLRQIKTSVLADELKTRRQIVSGRNREDAKKELRKDSRRHVGSIDVDVDEDELINDMGNDDLLVELKNRNILPKIISSEDELFQILDKMQPYNFKRLIARLTDLPNTATKEQIINALAEKL